MGSIKPPEYAGLKPNKGVKKLHKTAGGTSIFFAQEPGSGFGSGRYKNHRLGIIYVPQKFVCAQNQPAN